MKTKRTITIEKNELIRFLKEKLGVAAHLMDIDCTVESDRSSKGELQSLTLEWTEGSAQSEVWNR